MGKRKIAIMTGMSAAVMLSSAGAASSGGLPVSSVKLNGDEYKPKNQSLYEQRRRELLFSDFSPGKTERQPFFLMERRHSYLNPPDWMKFYFRIKDDSANVPVLVELSYLKGKVWHVISAPVNLYWDGEKIADFGGEPLRDHIKAHRFKYYNDQSEAAPRRDYFQTGVNSSAAKAENGLHVLTVKDAFQFPDFPVGVNYTIANMISPVVIITGLQITAGAPGIELVKIEEFYDQAGETAPPGLPPGAEARQVKTLDAYFCQDRQADRSREESFIRDKAVTAGHILDKLWHYFDHAPGAVSRMLIRNDSDRTLRVKDIAVDNAAATEWLTRGRIQWFKVSPEEIPPHSTAEAAVRFTEAPPPHRMTVRFADGDSVTAGIQRRDESGAALTLLATDRDRRTIFIGMEGGREFIPVKAELGTGEKLDGLMRFAVRDLAGKTVTWMEAPLPWKTGRGEWLDVILEDAGRNRVSGRLRVWDDEFILGAWNDVGYDEKKYQSSYGIAPQYLRSVWACAGGGEFPLGDVEKMARGPYMYIISGNNAYGSGRKKLLESQGKKPEAEVESIMNALKAARQPYSLEHADEIINHDVLTTGYPGYYAQLLVENQRLWERDFPYALSSMILGNTMPLEAMRIYGRLSDWFVFDNYLNLDPREDIIGYRSFSANLREAARPGPGIAMLASYRGGNLLKKQPQKAMDYRRFAVINCVALGVRGMTYFALSPDPVYGTPEFWAQMSELNQTLGSLLGLLNKSCPVKLAETDKAKVLADTVLCGGDSILLTLSNIDYTMTPLSMMAGNENDLSGWNYPAPGLKTKVRVTLPDWFRAGQVSLLREGKKHPVDFRPAGNGMEMDLPCPQVAEMYLIESIPAGK